jgi:uncharacterized protein
VTAVSRVNVTGLLAQMGRGMIEDVGDQVFQIFTQCMRKELEGGADSTATATPTAAATPAATTTSTSSTAPGAPTLSPAIPLPGGGGGSRGAPEALDVGALGAKAALRSLTAPTPLWVSLLLAAVVLYLLFR